MKTDNNTLQVVLEPALDEVISNTLVKANVTDQIITSLKEKYGNMRLANIEDKETYLDIKEARKQVRKVGILTEKLCKKGREDAVAIQRKWLAKEKEILEKIAEVENPLNDEIEKFDNEVERKELEDQKRKEGIYMNRQSILSKMGAIYDNGNFVLNHISYEVELIKQADNEQWNDTILPKYRKVYEEIEAVRVAEENKRKEEIAQQKKEREEFEAKQKEFKEQQELFAKKQKQLREQQEEADKKEHERKLQEQRLIDAANEKKWRDRLANLNAISWDGQEACSGVDGSVVFTYSELIALPDDIFFERAKEYINSVAMFNKVQEEKRLAQIEKEKQAAIELAAQQEREKIAEEQMQVELTKQREEANRQQRLAESNDKTKWEHFLKLLATISFPTELKSSIYKSKLSIAKEKISEIKDL